MNLVFTHAHHFGWLVHWVSRYSDKMSDRFIHPCKYGYDRDDPVFNIPGDYVFPAVLTFAGPKVLP